MAVTGEIAFTPGFVMKYRQNMLAGDDWNGVEPVNAISGGFFAEPGLFEVAPDVTPNGGKFKPGNSKPLKFLKFHLTTDRGMHWSLKVGASLASAREIAVGGPGETLLEHIRDSLGYILPGESVWLESSGAVGDNGSIATIEFIADSSNQGV